MIVEMKIPSPGESVTEVVIETWLKQDGEYVEMDEALAEIQSDKAMLSLNAEKSGILKIKVPAGETVAVGSIACTIDTDAAAPAASAKTEAKAAEASAPVSAIAATTASTSYASGVPSPSADKIMRDQGIDPASVNGTGKDGRITKADVLTQGKPAAPASPAQAAAAPVTKAAPVFLGERSERREKMSQLRKKIAQRLVAVKNETAMLTTFNEVDLSAVMDIRKKYKDKFKEVHEVNLGFMSFFTKAVCEALKMYPAVNGQIQGDELVYFNYADIGIAVSTDRGLVVPNIRNADKMSLAEIEKAIMAYAAKARENKITLDDMTGGTFTITNGGVFGSLMSTPILNPPQSAILGMHNIVQRPVAINGQVEIRPMMYIALSYDHRIIDGKESVSFLVKVKEQLEDPARMLLGI
jgi:2-oxoglutarate dehydrogenase E2 component (dihydrolipoamide succinyltransferase)